MHQVHPQALHLGDEAAPGRGVQGIVGVEHGDLAVVADHVADVAGQGPGLLGGVARREHVAPAGREGGEVEAQGGDAGPVEAVGRAHVCASEAHDAHGQVGPVALDLLAGRHAALHGVVVVDLLGHDLAPEDAAVGVDVVQPGPEAVVVDLGQDGAVVAREAGDGGDGDGVLGHPHGRGPATRG